MPSSRPLRSALGELLLWIALLGIASAVRILWGTGSIGVWLVLYAGSFRVLRAYARRISPETSRRATLRKRFWRIVWLALPVAACVNFVTFFDTLRAYAGDGYEGIGWPIPFLERGGFAYEVRRSFAALAIDLASCIGIAVGTSLALRDGGRWAVTATTRFLCGRVKATQNRPHGEGILR